MPELPEIETIRRDLIPHLVGHRVLQLEVNDRRLLSKPKERQFQKSCIGQSWSAIERQGKYLCVILENNCRIIFHLRMTGQLVLQMDHQTQRVGILGKPLGTPPRLRMRFDHGVALAFFDQRRFGDIFLMRPGDPWPGKTKLGPDPTQGLSVQAFVRMVKSKSTRIKPLLMDQSFIAGVGNIYAQEALFRAGVRPSRPAHQLTKKEIEILLESLQATLDMAIDHRGSTSRNYRDAFGQQGSAQTLHAVYRRGGQPCLCCKTSLLASRVGGRGTVYCPQCQR